MMVMMASPSPSSRRILINRSNVKFLIRILLGFALSYIVGHLFQQTHAAPLKKTTMNDDQATTTWQPGLMKNCTEPGEEKIHFTMEISHSFFH